MTTETQVIEMGNTLATTNDAPPATGVADAPAACLISKVNEEIRPIDFGAYQPQSVMIGPYHQHQDPSGRMKTDMRQRYLPDSSPKLRQCIKAIEDLEDRARRCYDPPFSPTKDFASMLLLDGLFVLLWFMMDSRDRETMTSLITLGDTAIVRDIVYLLENQVPFFVVEKLYEVYEGGRAGDSKVIEKVAGYIGRLMKSRHYANTTVTVDPRPCHLLHLLHMHFRPVKLDENANANHRANMIQRAFSIPCHLLHQLYVYFRPTNPNDGGMPTSAPMTNWRAATYYHEKGVWLKPRPLDGDRVRSILDVEVTRGTLHVPCLTVDNETWRILRNLTALEQQNRHLGSHVTAYCFFLSQLASSEEDVMLLKTKNILKPLSPNAEEVAAGFASLCNGIVLNMNDPDMNYLRPTMEALENLCRSQLRKSMAWLRHKKCNNFAMAVGLAAGVGIFLFTMEQGVFAALSYFKRR